MKVILVNGSPHKNGTTNAALGEAAKTLGAEGVAAEIFWIGAKPISGCIGCGKCRGVGRCIFEDEVNKFLDIAGGADGFVFGSPVHYASAGGALTSFMDRAFYAGSNMQQNPFRLKPGAAVAVARRAGTTATLDQLNKYMTISEMPVVSSCYWNMVHGHDAEEAVQDKEGMQVMRVLARNMAFLIKCKEEGLKNGVKLPEREKRIYTNFIKD